MSERKPGWYWVKTIDHDAPEYWEPAFFSNGEWDHDLSIKIVGPRIPTPDEPWQMVPVGVTEQMIDASELEGDHAHGIHRHDVGGFWQAMLAAAPNPEDS